MSASTWTLYALAAVLFLMAMTTSCKTMAAEHEQGQFGPDMALIDDDGSLDTALINYLFARQMMRRLQSSLDVTDLQHKRSYWKQCAFNAVSCFGRK